MVMGEFPSLGALYGTGAAQSTPPMSPKTAGHTPILPLTGERTVPGIAEENYWFRWSQALCDQVKRRVTQ